MKKQCLNCNKPFEAKRGDAKFCGLECKNAYAYKQRPKRADRGRLSGLSLKTAGSITKKTPGIERSIVPVEKSTTVQPGITSPEKAHDLKAEPLVFSNVIYSHTGLPAGEKPAPEKPIVLPPAFLLKTTTEPNPVYADLEKKLALVNQQRALIEKSIPALKAKIEEVKALNGSEHIAIGAGLGALLGYQLGKDTTRSKASGNGGGVWALIFGIAGALAGNGTRSMSEKAREQEKAKELANLNVQLSKALKAAQTLQAESASLNIKRLGLPQRIIKQVKVPNPAYAPALKKQQEQKERISRAAKLGKTYPAGQDPHETGRILSAANMSQLNSIILNFQGPWLELLGQPQTNFKMLVSGESGSGKSHFAIQLAMYLAEFGRVLYVSGEEGFAATFQDKIRTMGAHRHPNFYTGDFRTGTELLAEAPNLYHFIVIDSINDMGISYEQYLQIIERFSQSGIVALFQSTKAGKFRGSNEFIHKSDIAVKVEHGIATTVKNRYKAAGEKFNVMDIYKNGKD